MHIKSRIGYLVAFVVLLLLEVCIALFVHDGFVRPYVGDLLVTVLLCCLCRVAVPKGLRLLPVYVFLFAALVELAQYFDVVALLGLEGNRLISTLVGRTFSFADIVCYGVGCGLFFFAEYGILRLVKSGQGR